VFRVLVAAAIITVLTLTAVTAEEIYGAGDWFRSILNIQLEEDGKRVENTGVTIRDSISDAQIEVVNDLGRVFKEQTQTSEGTTVTMHAAYGDAHILHLYLTAEAPEGAVLPDNILYSFHDGNEEYQELEERYVPLTPGENAPYKRISQQLDIEALPDDDPGDNKKDFHVVLYGQAGTDCSFNDGYSKFFNIRGIWQQIPNVDGDVDGYELLAPGEFAFEVGLAGGAEMIELKDAGGFVYGGEKSRTWTHDSPCFLCEDVLTGENDPHTGLPIHSETWVYEVTVKSMRVSSTSVEWEVEYTCDDEQKGFGLEFRVVMKDGTTPAAGRGGSLNDTPQWLTGGAGVASGLTYFSVPIDLAEVDYILIGDEDLGQTMKLYLP
ncbi:MAG: hypothetical protein IJ443_03125, partial [Firmicutes bacterium]|nr:hypothetical protein [Bacillota bacterium]